MLIQWRGRSGLRSLQVEREIAELWAASPDQAAEIALLRERIVFLQAEIDVLNGTACAEEQTRGKGPCGSCRTCRNERIAKLEAFVKAADYYFANEDGKDVLEAALQYDLARAALGEVECEG